MKVGDYVRADKCTCQRVCPYHNREGHILYYVGRSAVKVKFTDGDETWFDEDNLTLLREA